MPDYKGIGYLRKKMELKRQRVNVRYRYYEMKNATRYLKGMIPPEMQWMTSSLGWCAKAVDSLADRLSFYTFDNDNFQIGQIYDMNNRDILIDSAVLSALISSCSFIYIHEDDSGFPQMENIDGSNATGVIDERTYMLKEGYAVLERDKNGNPTLEAYFIPGMTYYYPKAGEPYEVPNTAPYPLLVPVIYRPDARRPFGHSRISRACMSYTQSALRTLLRGEVSSEFYSFPQKYVTGLSQDAERMDKYKAVMSAFMQFDKDDDGDKPTLGQFQQQSMTPYIDQLRMYASMFAGETGLTVDDLGFVSDNPSSAEAIKASHENLRLYARKAQSSFGIGLLNAGYLCACIRDEYPYQRNALYRTKPLWEPIFEPDMSTLSLIGDGAIKLNQAVPGFIGAKNLRALTGMEANSGVEEEQTDVDRILMEEDTEGDSE